MDSHAHWETVYEAKDASEVSWFQPEPARSLRWIEEATPDRSAPILDVGAGASRLVDGLLERGYRSLAALDVSAKALSIVRQRLGERADEVEWFVCDLLDFSPPQPFHLWHDRAVLHFLREPWQQARYAEVLRRTLASGGHALMAGFAPGGPTRCSGLDTVQLDAAGLQELLGAGFSLVREENEVHRTPTGGEQLFSYFLFRRVRSDAR